MSEFPATVLDPLMLPAEAVSPPAHTEPPPAARITLGDNMPDLDSLPVLRATAAVCAPAAPVAELTPPTLVVVADSTAIAPTLAPAPAPAAANSPVAVAVPAIGHRSSLAVGMAFTGQVRLCGTLIVGGHITGPVHAIEPSSGTSHVTISPGGVVEGDITARNITVHGRTRGLLDASGGRVALHAGAVVEGRIRYSGLQVDGADLNAQLERVRPDGASS